MLRHAGTAVAQSCRAIGLTDCEETSRVAIVRTQPTYQDTSSGTGCDGVNTALSLLHRTDKSCAAARSGFPGDIVMPGHTVLVKPNLIREEHLHRPGEWEQVVTHGSVVSALLDVVVASMGGRGRVVIADGPQTDSDFDAVTERTGLKELVRRYRHSGVQVELLDLRRERWVQEGEVTKQRLRLSGDPAGYTEIDLGSDSEFADYALSGRFYGADYDVDETRSYHSNGHHRYVLCRTVMDADVVINIPKMKTHKKTGVTLSLKNLVGINGHRNCLPHFTVGTPRQGGDEFPGSSARDAVQSRAISAFKTVLTRRGGSGGAWARLAKRSGHAVFGDTSQVVRSGNWYGNDTAWRMVLDLNKALFGFDGEGRPRAKPLRYLTVVDGIIGGDGDGPLAPDAVPSGVIVAGLNPVAVDTVCSALMGFDYRQIPVVERAWHSTGAPLVDCGPGDIECVSNAPEWSGSLDDLERAPHLGFRPHFGWAGHIERQQ